MVRQWGASETINDAWFYVDRRGLQVVAETRPTAEGTLRRQHIVGIIPWQQVRRALDDTWCSQCGLTIYMRPCGPTHSARQAALGVGTGEGE